MRFKIIILFLITATSVVCHAENHVISLDVDIQEKTITVKPYLNFTTSNQIKEAIDNGTRVQFIVKTQLYQPKDWWFNKDLDNKKIYLEVSYFTLSKLYVVKNKESGEQLGFNHYEQLWKEFEKLATFEFEKPPHKNIWVKLRVILDKGALPTVMQLPVLIDSNWEVNTPWHEQKIEQKW